MPQDNGANPVHSGKPPLKKLKVILIVAAVLAIMVLVYALVTRFTISVTGAEAMNIAVEQAGGGTAATPDLDWEIWRWAWYVEVWHNDFIHEIYVDARSGAVIRHEIERWD